MAKRRPEEEVVRKQDFQEEDMPPRSEQELEEERDVGRSPRGTVEEKPKEDFEKRRAEDREEAI